jgi:hypothetical protein
MPPLDDPLDDHLKVLRPIAKRIVSGRKRTRDDARQLSAALLHVLADLLDLQSKTTTLYQALDPVLRHMPCAPGVQKPVASKKGLLEYPCWMFAGGLRAVAELIDRSRLEEGPPSPPPDLLEVANLHMRRSCLELVRAVYGKGDVDEKAILLELWPEEAARGWPEEARKPTPTDELVAKARKGLSPEVLARASRLRAGTPSHGETPDAIRERLRTRLRRRQVDTNNALLELAKHLGGVLYRIGRPDYHVLSLRRVEPRL